MSSRCIPKNRALKNARRGTVKGYKKILPGQVFHMDGMRCTMGIVQWSGGNGVLDGRLKTLFGTSVKNFVWMGVKILHLEWASKKLCLDGHQNTLFGWVSKFVFWTDVQNLDSGILSGWGSKKFLLGGPDKLMDNM